jgi:hypothetical protein
MHCGREGIADLQLPDLVFGFWPLVLDFRADFSTRRPKTQSQRPKAKIGNL